MSNEEKNVPRTPPESRSSKDDITNAQAPRESRKRTRETEKSKPLRHERN